MSKPTVGEMTVDEFERVASTCNRWGTRSLNVVRALLVENKPLPEVAAKFEMTIQQASVHRSKFREKAASNMKRVSALDFMQAVKPDGDALFKPFRRELIKLSRSGYSMEQLLQYLQENDVKTSAKTLNDYMLKVISK